jgi:hypothetical protein
VYTFEKQFNWDDAEIKCSSSGKFISVLNKSNGYFVILQVNNKNLVLASEILEVG